MHFYYRSPLPSLKMSVVWEKEHLHSKSLAKNDVHLSLAPFSGWSWSPARGARTHAPNCKAPTEAEINLRKLVDLVGALDGLEPAIR